jgi:hypothetical protein
VPKADRRPLTRVSNTGAPAAAGSQASGVPDARSLAALPESELLDGVQRQTFRFFWEGAHPESGLARDRIPARSPAHEDLVTTGGSGFGVMALIVAVERGWVTRDAALARLGDMLDLLGRATCYHGVFPHFLNGRSGATLPFTRKDDGGDLVETSFLMMGLLCARQYFERDTPVERDIRGRISYFWEEVEWNWHTRGDRKVLYWHWSPNNGWSMDQEIRGWNECLVTYVLAAGSKRYPIDPAVYHRGFAAGRTFLNGKSYYDIELPLGMAFGGPLFFAHYSFCGLDPRGLEDRYADYWQQNLRHVRINQAHCAANPHNFKGYDAVCWGLTASDDWEGYSAHAPDLDNGTISPTAALSSMPYAPQEVLRTLRHFLGHHGEKIWGEYGFTDAFNEQHDWVANTWLAIDQGPIVVMIENQRTGLLWNLFMSIPEVQAGLRQLDFASPRLEPAVRG